METPQTPQTPQIKNNSGRNNLIAVALVLAFITAVWVKCSYFPAEAAVKKKISSEVLLNRIESVAKLVTVEGYFSEVYDYKDYWKYDYSPFQKKALIRIKARVSVGYDLTKMKMEALPEEQKIIITNQADPEILSIEHDLDYYDITEGTFNSFSEADYNIINKNAKEKIRAQAYKSDLFEAAVKEGNQLESLIEIMAENAGWTIEYSTRVLPDSLRN